MNTSIDISIYFHPFPIDISIKLVDFHGLNKWFGFLVWEKTPQYNIHDTMILWLEHLVGGDWNMTELWFSISWEFHHPIWRTHIFQRGRSTTSQMIMDDDWWLLMTIDEFWWLLILFGHSFFSRWWIIILLLWWLMILLMMLYGDYSGDFFQHLRYEALSTCPLQAKRRCTQGLEAAKDAEGNCRGKWSNQWKSQENRWFLPMVSWKSTQIWSLIDVSIFLKVCFVLFCFSFLYFLARKPPGETKEQLVASRMARVWVFNGQVCCPLVI